ncbi:MAG: hypothetical protein K2K64_08100 [Muribaculaceae bacterium]|nr:hypothetical protein [Muribaculaceae bacterium]
MEITDYKKDGNTGALFSHGKGRFSACTASESSNYFKTERGCMAGKVRKARMKVPEAFSKISDIENIDWEEERKAGMTVADASKKIDAFHSVLRGMNTILYLCNKRQV